MNTSKVYFHEFTTTPTWQLLDKMERLVKKAGIGTIPLKIPVLHIKIHFGELNPYISSELWHEWSTHYVVLRKTFLDRLWPAHCIPQRAAVDHLYAIETVV